MTFFENVPIMIIAKVKMQYHLMKFARESRVVLNFNLMRAVLHNSEKSSRIEIAN